LAAGDKEKSNCAQESAAVTKGLIGYRHLATWLAWGIQAPSSQSSCLVAWLHNTIQKSNSHLCDWLPGCINLYSPLEYRGKVTTHLYTPVLNIDNNPNQKNNYYSNQHHKKNNA
jgi:hypothetical protein